MSDQRNQGMMLFVEIGGPFRWLPTYYRDGAMRRVLWLWFGIGTYPQQMAVFLEAFKGAVLRRESGHD